MRRSYAPHVVLNLHVVAIIQKISTLDQIIRRDEIWQDRLKSHAWAAIVGMENKDEEICIATEL